MSDDGNDYNVGYKKPPKHTQFKSGKSGNPSGRPKGSKNKKAFAPLDNGNFYEFQKQIVDAGYEEIQVIKDGKPHTMNKIDALLAQLYKKAMSGDTQATRLILQYTQSSLEELGEAGHRVYRTTVAMREQERKEIFTPPPKPGSFGEILERVHLNYSIKFAYRELYSEELIGSASEGEPSAERDWNEFNMAMKKQYQELGDEPAEIEIPEIPSMFKL